MSSVIDIFFNFSENPSDQDEKAVKHSVNEPNRKDAHIPTKKEHIIKEKEKEHIPNIIFSNPHT